MEEDPILDAIKRTEKNKEDEELEARARAIKEANDEEAVSSSLTAPSKSEDEEEDDDDDQDDDDQDDDDQDDDDQDDDDQDNDDQDDKNHDKDDKNKKDKDSKDNKDTKGDKSEQQQQQKPDQQQNNQPKNNEQKPKGDDNANKSVKDEGKKGKGKEGKPEGQGSSGGSGANSGAPGGTNGTPTGGGTPGGRMPGGTPSPAPGSASGVGASSAGTAGSAAAGTGTAAGGTAAGGAAAGGAAAGGAAAGGAAAGGAAAGGAAAGGSAAGAGAAGFFATPPGWIVLIIIVVIILLIGLLSFFSMMGDMVLGKIKGFLQGIWDTLETVTSGDAAASTVNGDQILEAAQYLDTMGYDLEGMGFVKTEYEYMNDKGLIRKGENWYKWYDENGNLQEDCPYWYNNNYGRNEEYTIRDVGEKPNPGESKGELTNLDSFPVYWYLVTQARSYVNGEYKGMIKQQGIAEGRNFFERLWNAIVDNLAFHPKDHILTVTGSTNLDCSLEDWTDKYGGCFEFFVCLHLGTMSPEFVLDLCGSGDDGIGTEEHMSARTQIEISFTKQEGWINVDYDDGVHHIDDIGRRLPDDASGEQVIDGITIPEAVVQFCKDHKNSITVNFPYIVRTWHHWYRDVVFADSNTGEPYCYEYGDTTTKNLDRSGYESLSGVSDNFKVRLVFASSDGGIKQTKRPYYIDKEPKIINLINNVEYHIFKGTYSSDFVAPREGYDGAEGYIDADGNEVKVKYLDEMNDEEKKEFASNLPYYTDKRKVKFLGSIKDGMQLLAQVKTAQAQYNLRDLKEILSYYNYIIEEEEDTEEEYSSATDKTEKMAEIEYEKWLKDWRHRVSGYFVPSEGWARYESSNPSADLNWGKYIQMDPEDMPTRTASTHTLDDRSMTIAARTVGGTGFNEDEAVCSTINGTIVAIDDSSITIKSDNGTVMNISHVATNSDLRVGDTVYIGTQVAKTTDEDINVIVKDKYHNTLNAEEIVNVNVLINQYA